MTDQHPGNVLQRAKRPAEEERSDFRYLDAAATGRTIVLEDEKIPYLFLGGYATSLIGGVCVTEDIDVIVGRGESHRLARYARVSTILMRQPQRSPLR
ncbi:hypothetical protein N7540_002496 [Penicillium herquei]|nr:hypothetical protein N7540_002496 [Penicillium herquei]